MTKKKNMSNLKIIRDLFSSIKSLIRIKLLRQEKNVKRLIIGKFNCPVLCTANSAKTHLEDKDERKQHFSKAAT